MNQIRHRSFTFVQIIIVMAIIALLAAFVVPAKAQSGPIDNIITNLLSASLADETIGIATGPVMHGASTFDNALLVDYSFSKKTSLFLRAEIQNGTSSDVVNSLGVGGGFYKSWSAARGYGFLMGRRNWNTRNWEGVGGLGVAYTPVQTSGSTLAKFSLFAEERLVISRNNKQPGTETVAGIRYSF